MPHTPTATGSNSSIRIKTSYLAQVLRIEQSRIMFMPDGVFAGMRKLQELTVAGGNLNKLTKTTFNGLNKLKRLSLNHNNLTKLDRDLFKFQQNLEYLDISHNNFQKLEPYFFKVSRLPLWFLCWLRLV